MRYLIFLMPVLFFIACSNHKEVISKNAAGTVIEKYTINKDSVIDGLYEAYFDNGALKERAEYKNGNLNGQRVLFFPNGQTEIVENYIRGSMNGDYLVYYESGALLLKQQFQMDSLVGQSFKYYENGELEEEVSFSNNMENGPFKEYYENGQVHWEGTYLNGDNEFGLLKEYDEDGNLIKKMMCDSLAVCRTIWTPEEGDISPKY